jgi:hypothetical protein
LAIPSTKDFTCYLPELADWTIKNVVILSGAKNLATNHLTPPISLGQMELAGTLELLYVVS